MIPDSDTFALYLSLAAWRQQGLSRYGLGLTYSPKTLDRHASACGFISEAAVEAWLADNDPMYIGAMAFAGKR